MDKRTVKHQIQFAEYGMVHHPVTYASFVYATKFRVTNIKMFVGAMSIGFTPQLVVKLVNFFGVVFRKNDNIKFFGFSILKIIKRAT